MANLGSDDVLSLVRQALGQIDDRPVSVTARRAARIASLLGETELAVYLGFELKPTGGHPPANAANTRRLMADPSLWADPDGPSEAAMATYKKIAGQAKTRYIYQDPYYAPILPMTP